MALTEPFDSHSQEYEQWFDRNHLAYQSELEAVRAQLPETGEGFEIGVGSGLFAAPLGIHHGVEPSEPMRGLALEKGIEAVNGVAEDLPYEDESFDYALMVTPSVSSTIRQHHSGRPNGSFGRVEFWSSASSTGKAPSGGCTKNTSKRACSTAPPRFIPFRSLKSFSSTLVSRTSPAPRPSSQALTKSVKSNPPDPAGARVPSSSSAPENPEPPTFLLQKGRRRVR